MQRLTIQLLTAWVMAAVANFGHATPVVICTEAVDGCRAAIPTSAPELFVYSDGESQADPYGFVDLATGQRVHVSDAIELSVDWLPDPLAIDAFGSDGWQRLSDSYTWVLP